MCFFHTFIVINPWVILTTTKIIKIVSADNRYNVHQNEIIVYISRDCHSQLSSEIVSYFVSSSSIVLTILNTPKITCTKRTKAFENLQMDLLSMMGKLYIVSPMKIQCLQINVVSFFFPPDKNDDFKQNKNVIDEIFLSIFKLNIGQFQINLIYT